MTVDGTLDMDNSCLDGDDGICHCQFCVVMDMDTQRDGDRTPYLPDDLFDFKGQCTPVGIAEYDTIRPCLLSRRDRREGVFLVSLKTIEEVLGVEDDFGHVLLEKGDGFDDQFHIFFQRNIHRNEGVDVPRLADKGYHLCLCINEGADVGVLFRCNPLPRRAPKGHDLCGGKRDVVDFVKVLDIPGIGTGPSSFDVVNAQLIKLLRDPQLVFNGEGDILRLGSIPQGSIVDLYLHYPFPLSNSKASWRDRTASSVYLASMIQEILISEVLIILMLIPSFARVLNILEATPEWLLIPTPTIETLAISSSAMTSLAPNSFATDWAIFRDVGKSSLEMVKAILASPSSRLEVWMIMSTMMFALLMASKKVAAMPGLSGTLAISILAWFVSYVTPDTTTCSISTSSSQTMVPSLSLNDERT